LQDPGQRINPVAVLVQKATYEWPAQHGRALLEEFNWLTSRFLELAERWRPREGCKKLVTPTPA
jgi:adenine-specific DNA methylase